MFLAQTSCIMFKPRYYAIVVAGRGIEPLSVPYDGLLLIELLYDSLSEIGRFLTVLPLHQPAM